jgi:hypothetical protein
VPSGGFGVRSDSRATAITTAPASTASPASWPPIRRESSGTVAAASATRTVLCGLAGGRPSGVVLGVTVGATVGNSPVGLLPGDAPLPDSGGRLTGGSVAPSVGLNVGVEVAVGRATTTSVAEPLKECAALPAAVAVSWTCSPTVALPPTRTLTSSSSACSSGTLPILHVAPTGSGHTLKLGDRTSVARATRTVTATPLPAAFVLHTQITKLATCPGLTCDELEKDWTRTHSCGFLAGVGDLLVGVGVGVGDTELGLGVGEPVGLELLLFNDDDFGVGLERWVGFGAGFLVVGLDDGVWLGDELLLDVGPALELELADELGLGLVVTLLDGVELAPALLPADFVLGECFGGLPGHLVTCVGAPDAGAITASRPEPFGTDEHTLLTIGGLAASAASARPNTAEERNAKPETAPTTAGLTTCALTRETSLQRSTRPDHPDAR